MSIAPRLYAYFAYLYATRTTGRERRGMRY